jgi:CRISPR-associated protein Csm2
MGRYKNALKSEWINNEIDAHCIEFMEKFGLYLCDKKDITDRFPGRNAVTTSQMRNIFSEVKRIEVKLTGEKKWEQERSKILLLRPKIAYNTARVISSKRESRMVDLREVLEAGLTAIHKKVINEEVLEEKDYKKLIDNFKRFSQVLEGIIAYHKVYGGKD